MVAQLDEKAADWTRRMLVALGLRASSDTSPTLVDQVGTELIGSEMIRTAGAFAAGGALSIANAGSVSASTPPVASSMASTQFRTVHIALKLSDDMEGLKDGELFELVVAQYLGKDRDVARRLINNNEWKLYKSIGPVTKADIAKKYLIVRLRVRANDWDSESGIRTRLQESADYLSKLKKDDQKLLEDYAYKKFWKKTKYKEGQRLQNGDANDEKMMEEWLRCRNEVVELRIAVDQLDRNILEFILPNKSGPPLSPEHYGQLLEVAEQFEKLKRWNGNWQDFASQVTERHRNLDELRTQIEAYSSRARYRDGVEDRREEAKSTLVGKDKLYETYKALLAKREHLRLLRESEEHLGDNKSEVVDLFGTLDKKVSEVQADVARLEGEFQGLLKAYGYATFKVFEAEMAVYVDRFEKEAEVVAEEMLNRGENQLLEQEEALTDANLGTLFKNLGKARSELAKMPDDDLNEKLAKNLLGWETALLLDDYSGVVREVVALSKSDALLMAHFARDGVTLPISVKLASLKNVGELRDLLLDSIKSKRDDVLRARKFLKKDPKLVWRFDVVQAETKARSDVQPGSLYDSILKDKQEADAKSARWKNIKEAILAVVLGALTFGTGTIAMAAGMAAIVVGVGGAMDAIQQYKTESSAHGAGLLSKDPSFAWVVLAFAGVGLDAMGIGGVVKGVSKSARAAELLQDGSPIGDAVRAFNNADDQMAALTKLDDELKAAEKELKLANHDLRSAIMREARAEAKANAMPHGPVLMIVSPTVTVNTIAKSFNFPAFQLLRKGKLGLSRFLKMRRVRALTGKVDGPEALKKVKAAYEKSVSEAKAISKRIEELKLPDEVVEQATKIWARSPNMTPSEFIETAQRIKRLKLNDESFERALLSWELNPKMTVGEFMENMKTMSRIVFNEGPGAQNITARALAAHFGYPAFRSVRKGQKFMTMPEVTALVGKVDELGPNGRRIVDEAYRLAKVEAEKIVKRAKDLKISDDALDDALTMWRLNPSMTVDEFVRKLAGYIPRGAKRTPVRAAKEFNDGKTVAINAPDEVMDATTRDVLRRQGGPPTAEKIAGTGGVQKIEAREINGEIHVSIEGEILPHRLKREGIPDPGQSPAPNFNKANYEKPRPKDTLPPMHEMGFKNPDHWQRLHLWGPGFGDEAAAGMFVGTRELNLAWQNSGIEDVIRHLGTQIAPLQQKGYRMKVIAKVESWGSPTPKGFKTANGERLARKVEYEIVLTTPHETRRARLSLEDLTDPADVNGILKDGKRAFKKPEITTSLNDSPMRSNRLDADSLNMLFDLLPD